MVRSTSYRSNYRVYKRNQTNQENLVETTAEDGIYTPLCKKRDLQKSLRVKSG